MACFESEARREDDGVCIHQYRDDAVLVVRILSCGEGSIAERLPMTMFSRGSFLSVVSEKQRGRV